MLPGLMGSVIFPLNEGFIHEVTLILSESLLKQQNSLNHLTFL